MCFDSIAAGAENDSHVYVLDVWMCVCMALEFSWIIFVYVYIYICACHNSIWKIPQILSYDRNIHTQKKKPPEK